MANQWFSKKWCPEKHIFWCILCPYRGKKCQFITMWFPKSLRILYVAGHRGRIAYQTITYKLHYLSISLRAAHRLHCPQHLFSLSGHIPPSQILWQPKIPQFCRFSGSWGRKSRVGGVFVAWMRKFIGNLDLSWPTLPKILIGPLLYYGI